jgi:hypothetical protein
LRKGRVQLQEQDVHDATTRRTLADTTMAIDREQLLRQIDQLRTRQGHSDEPPRAEAAPPSSPGPKSPLLAAIEDLFSGEPGRARHALTPPLDRRLASLVIPLLADPDLGRAARRALRASAPQLLGLLIDSMLDPEVASGARRRLPEVIASCRSRRAVEGLLDGLEADDAQVRKRSALALRELVDAAFEHAPSRARVFEAANSALDRREVEIRQVFIILGLALEREPLDLALKALRSDDANLRGTSYEYLENVLPDDLRQRMWPHLHAHARTPEPRQARVSRRSEAELAADLRRSIDSLEIDVSSLKPPPE